MYAWTLYTCIHNIYQNDALEHKRMPNELCVLSEFRPLCVVLSVDVFLLVLMLSCWCWCWCCCYLYRWCYWRMPFNIFRAKHFSHLSLSLSSYFHPRFHSTSSLWIAAVYESSCFICFHSTQKHTSSLYHPCYHQSVDFCWLPTMVTF